MKIIIQQIKQKLLINFLLLLAITSLVTVYIYLKNTSRFLLRSIQLIEKNVGHNIIIIDKNSRPIDYYQCNENLISFSDKTTARMAGNTDLASKYYVSMLQKKIKLNNETFILSGIKPEKRSDETKEKANMITVIKKGETRLGSETAKILNLGLNDKLKILNKTFTVTDILKSDGNLKDYRIFINLSECQKMLNLNGNINAILAFECLLGGKPLPFIEKYQRKVLAQTFPDFQQITKMDIAHSRYLSRMSTSKYLKYLLKILFIATIIIIIISSIHDINERRQEIGIMISMGANYIYIIAIYVLKLFIIAFLSSIIGFFLGSFLAIHLNSSYILTNTQPMKVLWNQLPEVILLTILVSIIAEIIPMFKLVRVDPCTVLTEE